MIKFKRLKGIRKNYNEVYTNLKQTDKICIQIGNDGVDSVELQITDQQYGLPLSVPHVEIITSKCSYSMDWNTFVNKIIK